jgi:hypothetical protein
MPSDPKRISSIRLPAVLAIGFTGHRSLQNEPKLRQVVLDFLRQQRAASPWIVYGVSSAAAGADQIFAESCLELEIPLRVLLPKPMEHFRNDFNPESWQRTERILEKAISVEVTGNRNEGKEQYYDCGIQTIAESQLLMAIWDGKPSRGAGGTQDIVSYAEEIGYPVVWIHSVTGELRILNEVALRRMRIHPELDFLNSLPDTGITLRSDSPSDLATAFLQKLDENANRIAPQARRLASIPIVYTAAAAVLSGVAPEIPSAAPWLALSAALGIVAIALPIVLRLHVRQALWARTRTAAEFSRSVLALWNTPTLYSVIGPELIPDLAGILRSMNFLKMNDRRGKSESLDEFKQEYLQNRVADQIDYFSRHAARAQRHERGFQVVSWICGLSAILIASGYLVTRTRWITVQDFPHQWIAFVMSSLFEIATMAGAFAMIKDSARRRRRYREMSEVLRQWQKQLDALHTWNSVLQIAEHIERALLVELLEWRSMILAAGLVRK